MKEYRIAYQRIVARTGEIYELQSSNIISEEEYITPYEEAERIAKNMMQTDYTTIGYKIISRDVSPWKVEKEEAKKEIVCFEFSYIAMDGEPDKKVIYAESKEKAKRLFDVLTRYKAICDIKKLIKPL